MSFRKVLFLGVVLVLVGTARAQVGVYGMYSGTDMSGVQCLAVNSACSATGGDVKPWGAIGGVYYDFHKIGPMTLGVDFRASSLHSNKSASSSAGGSDATGAQTFLGGVRGSFKTRISWLRPYAQISAGWTRSDVSEPSCLTQSGTTLLCSGTVNTVSPRQYDGFVTYEGFAGADVRVFPFLDLRAIELGIGNMNRAGTGNGSSSVGLRSIASGIVVRF